MLLNAIRRVDRYKPYRKIPLRLDVIDQTQPQRLVTLKPPKLQKDLSKALVSVANLLPQSHLKQCKIFLTYLDENDNVQINDKKNEILIHCQTCDLVGVVSELIVYKKRLELFYSFFV